MRITNLIYGLVAVALLSFSTQKTVNDTSGDWFFLADKNVGFGADHDVIHFGNWKDDVRQLKLKITDGR